MARKTERRTIDGLEFEVSQLDPRRAQRLSVRILGHLAGPLGQALRGLRMKPGQKLQDVEMGDVFQNLTTGLPLLAERLTADELESIQTELFQTAWLMKGGSRIPMMEAWNTQLESPFTAMKLTAFALEVNFASFFGGSLASRIATMKERILAGPSPESDTSHQSGPSGG